MKRNRKIVVTLVFLIIAVLIFVGTGFYSYAQKRAECFQRLIAYTEEIATHVNDEMEEDKNTLNHFASQLAVFDLNDTQFITQELSIRSETGLITRLELLFPNNQMLEPDGTTRDASNELSFDELKGMESYVSRRTTDYNDAERQVIRHCVPITQNGEVTAILCGVIDLADMPNYVYNYDYGYAFNVFVVEADTGMYIQDTWHDTLTSTDQYSERTAKDGYSFETFDENLKNREADTIVFVSETLQEDFYMHSHPAGVADWMVMVSVQESVVFAQARQTMVTLAGAATFLLMAFILYFIWLLNDVHFETIEKEKQLKNTNYMLAVETYLFDAHVYPEHFEGALNCVKEYMNAQFTFMWLTETTWALKDRYWYAGEDFLKDENTNLSEQFPRLAEILNQNGELYLRNKHDILKQFPIEGNRLIDNGIENIMLIPVRNAQGENMLVLGACNMEFQWENLLPLQQVSLSFSMTVNHFEAYKALEMMGTTDVMTDVLNRNSYDAAIEMMNEVKPDMLGCVYIDVNGLHEINNFLGHQEGDKMLQIVAEALKQHFKGENIYRIGGDEFVVLCEDWQEQAVKDAIKQVHEEMRKMNYDLSVGIVWEQGDYDINKVIEEAEKRMRDDKESFYQQGGKERRVRNLNERVGQIITEKNEADAFLSILEPEFKGVHFVNLDSDEASYLFVPDYFNELVKVNKGSYHNTVLAFAHKYVADNDVYKFEEVANYDHLKDMLDHGTFKDITYSKKDGTLMALRIVKMDNHEDNTYKTQWIYKRLS